MSEHIHTWIKSSREHGRKGFFFVYCECTPEKMLQATENYGYLHVFDTSVNRGGKTTVVTARLDDTYMSLLKNSNKTVRELLEESLDKYRDL